MIFCFGVTGKVWYNTCCDVKSTVSSYNVWVLSCFSLPLPLHLCAGSSALSSHSSSSTTFYSFPLAEGESSLCVVILMLHQTLPFQVSLVSKVSDCWPWASSHSCIPASAGLWDCAEVSKRVQPKGAGLKMVEIHPVHILGDLLWAASSLVLWGPAEHTLQFNFIWKGPVWVSCSSGNQTTGVCSGTGAVWTLMVTQVSSFLDLHFTLCTFHHPFVWSRNTFCICQDPFEPNECLPSRSELSCFTLFSSHCWNSSRNWRKDVLPAWHWPGKSHRHSFGAFPVYR